MMSLFYHILMLPNCLVIYVVSKARQKLKAHVYAKHQDVIPQLDKDTAKDTPDDVSKPEDKQEDLDGVGESEMEDFSVTICEAQNKLTFEEEEPGDPEADLEDVILDGTFSLGNKQPLSVISDPVIDVPFITDVPETSYVIDTLE